MAARFITAPDKIPLGEERRKILIVDSDWHDIESLTLLCMTRNINIDFYLFGPTSANIKWLDGAVNIADVILVNNASDRNTDLKEKITKDNNVLSIGTANDKYNVPLAYIIKEEI